MLRDARAIVSDNQSRINDTEIGDKGPSAKVVLDQAAHRAQQLESGSLFSGRPHSRPHVLRRSSLVRD
jgi:hypothetical protein